LQKGEEREEMVRETLEGRGKKKIVLGSKLFSFQKM